MKNKKSILIINTGGTLGMQRSEDGYIPKPNYLGKQLKTQTEFQHQDMPNLTVMEYQPLLDSSDMQPPHWNKIAEDIASHYDNHDGFVILHGTDTMAYTASALSFMLEKLTKPVILTGSQVPLCEIHTDARENLINAILMASRDEIAEVCVYFNNQLLRGNRCQKFSAKDFDAFASPNFPLLGKVGTRFEMKPKLLLEKTPSQLSIQTITPHRIDLIRLMPGFTAQSLQIVLAQQPRALILETYGIGNAPLDKHFHQALDYARDHNILIINHSQCFKAMVDMESYANGQALMKKGVLSAKDMTTEAIYCKLLYLFSKYTNLDDIKTAFEENLVGEVQ